MTEEIIIDGIDVSKCEAFFKVNKTCYNCYACEGSDCYFKQLKRLEQENNSLQAQLNNITVQSNNVITALEQENEELSKLIRGTKDYAEVCSVCKDEVTVYPNISGRTDYTQNEVECRTLKQIIARKNNLEQENKELKKFFDSAAKKNTSLENKIKEYHEQYDELYWTTDQLVKDKTKLKQTLEEIIEMFLNQVAWVGQLTNFEEEIYNKVNEVLK